MHRIEQITLRQLRALKTVGECRTVTAAAEVLNLTAPAVHSQLKNLEEIVGAPLLERAAKDHARLTRHGDALVRAFDEIRATLTRTITELDAIDSGQIGSVTLGVVSTGKYFAPRIVALLSREMPRIHVRLVVGNRSEIIDALARGAFDLCIMGRPPREPLVEAVPIGPNPHVLVALPDHPLAGRDDLQPEDLAAERFVLREPGSGTRILTERFLSDIAVGRPLDTIEMSSNETVKQSVLQGLGLAVLSAHTVDHELATGRLVMLRVPGMPILRTWYVTRSQTVARSGAAQQVQDWLIANATRYLPEIAV